MTVPPIDAAQADRFLQLLGKPQAAARLRAFPHRLNPRKDAIGPRKGPYDLPRASTWQHEGRGVYLVINDGGDSDSDITACRAFFLEWDDRPVPWQLSAWQRFGLGEPTLSVTTGGKSAHLYWVLTEPIQPDQWIPIQAALIELTGADPTNRNPSRVMRLPGAHYIGADGSAQGMTTIYSASGRTYSVENVVAWLTSQPTPQQRIELSDPVRSTDLPPRPIEALRQALQAIPPFTHGAGQYQQLLGLALRLRVEIGAAEAQQLLAETCCAAIRDLPSYFRTAPTQIAQGSVWAFLRETYGIDISRHDLRGQRPPPHTTPQQAPQRPAQDDDEPTYLDLLTATLQAIQARDLNREMEHRAALGQRFRRNDEQVNSALFDLLRRRRIQPVEATTESVDLTSLDSLEYLLDGWIIRNQLQLTYGPAGTGKTTLCLAKALAVCRGTGLLDRSTPAPAGRVLYIATDSGPEALRKALDDLDAADDPIIRPGPEQRLFIWADAPEQGQSAWCADITGMVRLVTFVERHQINLVIIDSAKAVTSRANVSYLSNEATATLLTFMAEVLCRSLGCAIDIISHDGTATGTHSGAKAWSEIPSMVVALQPITDEDGRRRGTMARVVKDRAAVIDPGRKVQFDLDREQAQLILLPGQEVVGNAEAAILAILGDAHQRGVETVSRKALVDEAFHRFKRSASTVDNTIPALLRRRLIVRPRRGSFALAPAQSQISPEMRPAAPETSPLIPLSTRSGKEWVKSIANTGALELPDDCPMGNPSGNSAQPPLPDDCPSGNSSEAIGQSQNPCPDRPLVHLLPDQGDIPPSGTAAADDSTDAASQSTTHSTDETDTDDWFDEFG